MPIWDDEQTLVASLAQQRQATTAAAGTASPRTTSSVSALLTEFPWLPPGVAYSLGASGTDAPGAAGLARAELNRQLQENPNRYSSIPNTRLWQVDTPDGKPLTFKSRKKAKQAAKQIHEVETFGDQGGGMGLIGKPLGLGMQAAGAVANFMATPLGPAKEPVKTGIRETMSAMQAPLDFTSGAIRVGLQGAKEGDFFAWQQTPEETVEDFSKTAEQSPFVQHVVNDKSLGKGFLPNPDSPAGRAAADAARRYSPYLIDGHAFTLGRGFADFVGLEPDDAAFTMLSGIIDLTVAFKGDPTAALFSASSESRAAGRLITPDADAAATVRNIEAVTDVAERQGLIDDLIDGRLTHTVDSAEWKAATATERQQMLYEAGAVQGRRKIMLPDKPLDLIYNNDDVGRLIPRLTAEKSPAAIYFGSGKQIPADVAIKLADSTDDAITREILAQEFGTSMQRIPDWRLGMAPPNRWRVKIPQKAQQFPEVGSSTYIHDLTTLVDDVDAHLAIIKVPRARRLEVADLILKAKSNMEIVRGVGETMKDSLVYHGVAADKADEVVGHLTKDYTDALEGLYGINPETGARSPSRLLDANGVDYAFVDGPRMLTERLQRGFFMPDPREVRRMVSTLQFADSKTWSASVGLMDAGMGVWRTMALARPALAIKIALDNMAIIAATDGAHSIFLHPGRWLGLAIGGPEDSRLARFVEKQDEADDLARTFGIDAEDLLDDRYDEIAAQLTRADPGIRNKAATAIRKFQTKHGSYGTDAFGAPMEGLRSEGLMGNTYANMAVDTRTVHLNHYEPIARGDKRMAEAVLQETVKLSKDQAVQRAMRLTPEQFREELWTKDWGKWYRQQMADGQKPGSPWTNIMRNRDASDAYAEVIQKAIRDATKGDQRLLDALRTGKINGKRMVDRYRELQSGAMDEVQKILDEGAGPTYSKIERTAVRTVDQKGRDLANLKKGVDTIFDWLAAKPSNISAYGPTFDVAYWERMKHLIPGLDPEARRIVLENLDAANLDKVTDRAIRRALAANKSAEGITLQRADQLAHIAALEHVRRTLDDFTNKGLFLDAARIVLPFGVAWKNLIQRWSRAIYEHPEIIRRTQQGVTAARESHFDPDTGLPSGDDAPGFFRFDPQTGQEVMTFPLSNLVTEWRTGIPIPLVGPVQGLNLIGQGLPGIGPAGSIPLSFILPDKPKQSEFMEKIFPFGLPSGSAGDKLIRGAVPTHIMKALESLNGEDGDRTFSSTVITTMRYLASTGEYDLQGKDSATEINRLINDAKSKAGTLGLIRAAGQFIGPTSPRLDAKVRGKTGELLSLEMLTADYHRLVQKYDNNYDKALFTFIKKYGVDNLIALEGGSKKMVRGLDTSTDQAKWATANPKKVEEYANTWALFAPGDEADFDYDAYRYQAEHGQRKKLTPKEMVLSANKHLAGLIYAQRQREMGGEPFTDREAAELRALKQSLAVEFEGYDQDFGPSQPNTRTAVRELQRAAQDPELRRTDAGQGLLAYLQVRDLAYEKAASWGLKAGPWGSRRAVLLRAAMKKDAQSIIEEHPEFRRMWTEVFLREFPEEER